MSPSWLQDINIQKMLDGNHGVVLELLQWFFRNLGERGPLPGYSPHERRSLSKHGGCDKVPRYGVSEAAFKRWRMKGVLICKLQGGLDCLFFVIMM